MPKGVYPTNGQQNKKKQYPPEMVAVVMELYNAGHTQREIAAVTGCSQRAVWRLMQNHGLTARRSIIRDQMGSRNAAWKGSSAGYAANHRRVGVIRGKPNYCEDCGTTSTTDRYEWASISKRYDDPSDYKRLCVRCHRIFDSSEKNFGTRHAA